MHEFDSRSDFGQQFKLSSLVDAGSSERTYCSGFNWRAGVQTYPNNSLYPDINVGCQGDRTCELFVSGGGKRLTCDYENDHCAACAQLDICDLKHIPNMSQLDNLRHVSCRFLVHNDAHRKTYLNFLKNHKFFANNTRDVAWNEMNLYHPLERQLRLQSDKRYERNMVGIYYLDSDNPRVLKKHAIHTGQILVNLYNNNNPDRQIALYRCKGRAGRWENYTGNDTFFGSNGCVKHTSQVETDSRSDRYPITPSILIILVLVQLSKFVGDYYLKKGFEDSLMKNIRFVTFVNVLIS
eukprot:Awhi_evm1s5005